MATKAIRSYHAFWPYYLREHAKPATRAIHIAGTLTALFLLVDGIVADKPALLLTAVVTGYVPAWVAHFFVEKNLPATFHHPLWSLFSDLRMSWCWIMGQLKYELEKAGVRPS